jgi:hypothetical protein
MQPGGYRTGVLFEFGPTNGDPAGRAREVMFKSRIATLIYVNIGQPALAAELTDLQVRQTPQLQVVAALKNTSRRSVRTRGSLILYDQKGATFAYCPFPMCRFCPRANAKSRSRLPIPTSHWRSPPASTRRGSDRCRTPSVARRRDDAGVPK